MPEPHSQSYTLPPTPNKKKQNKLCVDIIGDSNVRGLGVLAQTEEISAAVVVNRGARVQDVADRVPMMLRPESDVVVLHLGTNNILDRNASTSDSVKHYDKSIDQIKTHIGKRLLMVCAVPHCKDERTTVETQKLNCYLKRKCERLGMHFIDASLTIADLGTDTVHLNRAAKLHLAGSIVMSAMGFHIMKCKHTEQ